MGRRAPRFFWGQTSRWGLMWSRGSSREASVPMTPASRLLTTTAAAFLGRDSTPRSVHRRRRFKRCQWLRLWFKSKFSGAHSGPVLAHASVGFRALFPQVELFSHETLRIRLDVDHTICFPQVWPETILGLQAEVSHIGPNLVEHARMWPIPSRYPARGWTRRRRGRASPPPEFWAASASTGQFDAVSTKLGPSSTRVGPSSTNAGQS